MELFGGIGAIRKALIRQNIPHRVIDYVKIDKKVIILCIRRILSLKIL